MIKNIIIAILGLSVVLCWLKIEPECIKSDDPNSVVIEYKCSSLDDYVNLPSEIVAECKSMAEESTRKNKMQVKK